MLNLTHQTDTDIEIESKTCILCIRKGHTFNFPSGSTIQCKM